MKFFALLALFLSGIAQAAPREPETYVPGLGEIMGSIQMRHAKLWFAAKGGNWPLASYELGELKEGFEDAARYQPDFKGKPIAEMLEPATRKPLSELVKAIDERDGAHFARAYDQLSRACTSCHESAGRGFIVIQRPTAPPVTDQRYDARR